MRGEVVPAVRACLATLRQAGRCRRAWLFGSYAWGQPTGRSDVDLLVEGAAAPFSVAAEVGRATGRMVHVVPLEDAPASLVDRARTEGCEV